MGTIKAILYWLLKLKQSLFSCKRKEKQSPSLDEDTESETAPHLHGRKLQSAHVSTDLHGVESYVAKFRGEGKVRADGRIDNVRKRPSKSDGKIIGGIPKQESDGKIIDGVTEQEYTDPSKTAKLETKKEDLIVSDGGETKLCFFDSKLKKSKLVRNTEGSSLPNAQLFPTERDKIQFQSFIKKMKLQPINIRHVVPVRCCPDYEKNLGSFRFESDDNWGDEVKLHRFKVRTFQLREGGDNSSGAASAGSASDSGSSIGQGSSQGVGAGN